MALPNDHSGTINPSYVSTLLLPAGTAASGLLLQNVNSVTGDLFVNWGAPATSGPGSIRLRPGQSVDSSVIPVGAAIYGLATFPALAYTLKTD